MLAFGAEVPTKTGERGWTGQLTGLLARDPRRSTVVTEVVAPVMRICDPVVVGGSSMTGIGTVAGKSWQPRSAAEVPANPLMSVALRADGIGRRALLTPTSM